MLLTKLEEVLNQLRREATVSQFYARVPANHVLGEDLAPVPIEPNRDYVDLILSQMYICDRRVYWQNFVPMVIANIGFLYGRDRRKLPTIVGSTSLKEIESYVEGQQVQYLNARLLGPVPYIGEDLELFLGLFRVQADNVVASFSGIVENIVRAFDVAKASEYFRIAGALGDGLAFLFGLRQKVQARVLVRDVFNDIEGSPARLRNGYLAIVNCPKGALSTERLWVKEGRLHVGPSRGNTEPLRSHDFCLLRMSGRPRRNDYRRFGFHDTWLKCAEHIIKRERPVAESVFAECCREIGECPDLTNDQQQNLQLAYHRNYRSLVESRAPSTIQTTVTAYRGSDGGVLSAVQTVGRTAMLAQQAGVEKSVVGLLYDLRDHWDQIPEAMSRGLDADLSDEFINEQLDAIATFSSKRAVDPKSLADAIAISALSPHVPSS